MATKADNIVELPDIKVPGIQMYKNELEWEQALSTYFGNLKRQPKQPASPESGNTINDFFTLVTNALTTRQNSEGVSEDHRLLFIEEDPPKEISTEAITFELAKRMPGTFSAGPAGNGKVREVTAHFRSEIESPDRPGEKLITMGKRYDNYITFYCWAKNHAQARKRLIWFEEVMEAFRWYFRLFGFVPVYQGTDRRELKKVGQLTLTRYPVTYFVQTDDTYQISRQELRSLIINAEVSRN